MTAENRWLFDFVDLLQVHFVCHKCKAALSVPPRKIQHVPPQCVNCGGQLYSTQEEQKLLQALGSALEGMADFTNDKLKIRFESASPHTQSVSGT